MAEIKVYGADWCSMTKNTLAHLDELKITYQYINIDHDRKAAKWVADQNDGKERSQLWISTERCCQSPAMKNWMKFWKKRGC